MSQNVLVLAAASTVVAHVLVQVEGIPALRLAQPQRPMPADDGVDADPSLPLASSTPAPLTCTVPEAARMLGIGETLMRELIRTGRVPVLRLGRRVLVSRAALERLVG
jgi:excisionase family DNA binding protein